MRTGKKRFRFEGAASEAYLAGLFNGCSQGWMKLARGMSVHDEEDFSGKLQAVREHAADQLRISSHSYEGDLWREQLQLIDAAIQFRTTGQCVLKRLFVEFARSSHRSYQKCLRNALRIQERETLGIVRMGRP